MQKYQDIRNEKEIEDMLTAGKSVQMIATHYRVPYGSAYYYIRKHGIKPRKEDKKPIGCTEEKMKRCYYGGKAGGINICDYIGVTGHMRQCMAQACTEYKWKRGRHNA